MSLSRASKRAPFYLDKGCITKVKVNVRNYTAKLVHARKRIQRATSTLRADLIALDTMPRSEVTIASTVSAANGESTAKITITNRSNHIAFFLRVSNSSADLKARPCWPQLTET